MVSLTLTIYAATTVLLAWGAYRKPETIMAVLALAFVAGIICAAIKHGDDLRPLLMGIDALIVAVMAGLWVKHHSQRARFVGFIGFAQVSFALIYASGPHTNWQAWAAVENTAFIVQVLIAGGFADGIAAWLDNWGCRLRSRWAVSHRIAGGR